MMRAFRKVAIPIFSLLWLVSSSKGSPAQSDVHFMASTDGSTCPVRANWHAMHGLTSFTVCTWYRLNRRSQIKRLLFLEDRQSVAESDLFPGTSSENLSPGPIRSAAVYAGETTIKLKFYSHTTGSWIESQQLTPPVVSHMSRWDFLCIRWKSPEITAGTGATTPSTDKAGEATQMKSTSMGETTPAIVKAEETTKGVAQAVNSTSAPSAVDAGPSNTNSTVTKDSSPEKRAASDQMVNSRVEVLVNGEIVLSRVNVEFLFQGHEGLLWLQKPLTEDESPALSHADYGRLSVWNRWLDNDTIMRQFNCSFTSDDKPAYLLTNGSFLVDYLDIFQSDECHSMEPFTCWEGYTGVPYGEKSPPLRNPGFPVIGTVSITVVLIVILATVTTVTVCNQGHCDKCRKRYRNHSQLRSHRTNFGNPIYGELTEQVTMDAIDDDTVFLEEQQISTDESNGRPTGNLPSNGSAAATDYANVVVHHQGNGKPSRNGRKVTGSDRLVMITAEEELDMTPANVVE